MTRYFLKRTQDILTLHLKNLEKSYGAAFRLGPLTLRFELGTTVGILGKNGAGKSTLFEILTGNLDATKGEVFVGSSRLTPDTPELKRQIGYMPQNLRLPKWVSPRDILMYAASLYEIPTRGERVAKALRYWDCQSYQDKPLAACSHGMQKRVALALATLQNPPILILDEPFETLDIIHVKALEREIERRRQAGQLTILSTHMAPYAAKLCLSIYMVQEGGVSLLEGWNQGTLIDRVVAIEEAFTRLLGATDEDLHP